MLALFYNIVILIYLIMLVISLVMCCIIVTVKAQPMSDLHDNPLIAGFIYLVVLFGFTFISSIFWPIIMVMG